MPKSQLQYVYSTDMSVKYILHTQILGIWNLILGPAEYFARLLLGVRIFFAHTHTHYTHTACKLKEEGGGG